MDLKSLNNIIILRNIIGRKIIYIFKNYFTDVKILKN